MSPLGTLKIVLSPDPGLRQVCDPCTPGDPKLANLAKKMATAMYRNNGCGLAGPQVGVQKRIIVIDCTDDEEPHPTYLVNPVIEALEGEPVTDFEGCLSLPGISVPITRQPFARVSYYDLEGNKRTIEGDGLLGRCLQHEIDHLDGKTLIESAAPMDRMKAMKDYYEALSRGAQPGDIN